MQPDFIAAGRSIGCLLQQVRTDDRIHRCATVEHPKKRNASYRTDGQRGWVKNWETGETVTWRGAKEPTRKSSLVPLPSLAVRRAEEEKRAQAAAKIARQRISAAVPGFHPYLERKGFPEIMGLVWESTLLVPAYVGRDLVSLQTIAEDGAKKNLPGGRMAGASFSIGNGTLEILCEGYATGLSIKAALAGLHVAGRVTCCFSASNVATVAEKRRHALIIADNDRPVAQFGGLGTGEYYARKSGCIWGMPPEQGTDANDFHQRESLFALQALVLDLIGRRDRKKAA